MTIALHVCPGPALTKQQFLETHEPFSVALDGYVYGEPWLEVSARGPFRNFNHHELVDRSCMCATCEQARRAVALGFYDMFRCRGERRAQLYVNDCDQDVCLATWVLLNPDRAAEPLVRIASQIVDLLDMSAGTFPMPHERELLGQVRWVFEPYQRARPRLAELGAAGMREVITDVHSRLDAFTVGRADTFPLVGEWERVGGGDGWTLARVTHQTAREKMVAAGVRAAVELFGSTPSGNRTYSVWRRSEYVASFPVREILRALNVAEGLAPDDVRGWGGAENVGGSPRGVGSALSPADVERVVNSVISQKTQHTYAS